MSGGPIAGIPTDGEIAVLGLARSGRAVAALLASRGHTVYASDSSASPEIRATVSELTQRGIAAEMGAHDLARIGRSSLVVVSPGIPPGAPPLMAARGKSIPVHSEVDVALRALDRSRVIAITGTNGKSTTTAMVAGMLTELGVAAVVAGNIGRPLSEVAALESPPEWIALEVSSFQLHDSPSLRPDVGVLTNLSPDHLDRYESVDQYYADKALLFRNASSVSAWVINGDEADCMRMAAGVAGSHATFSLEKVADAWLDRESASLRLHDESLMPRADLRVLGLHNVANALAGALAVSSADTRFTGAEARERIARALRNFKPLRHRLELLGESRGVQWINDSKATNVGAALVALEAMERPTVLLLGGRHKGEPYAPLVPQVERTVKLVVAYGEAAALIASELSAHVEVRRIEGSFETAVGEAAKASVKGDALLLSPACSSYDMFADYEERGARFAELYAETARG